MFLLIDYMNIDIRTQKNYYNNNLYICMIGWKSKEARYIGLFLIWKNFKCLKLNVMKTVKTQI